MADVQTVAEASPDVKSRFDSYAKWLQNHKERKTVKELVERELLMMVIKFHHERINEFPLLKPQQEAIVNFLTIRTQGELLEPFIEEQLTAFLLLLTKYNSLILNGEDDAAAAEISSLSNLEVQLIKLIQGVVYATALTIDNFSEILIKYYGETALDSIDAILEKTAPSAKFWKEHFDHFIATEVTAAYDSIVENKSFTLSKANNQLIIGYAFDDVLAKLNPTTKAIDKTRVQAQFTECGHTLEEKASFSALTDYLSRLSEQNLLPIAVEDIPFTAKVACMDPSGKHFHEAITFFEAAEASDGEAPEAIDADGLPMTPENAKFTIQQALNLCCGTAIAVKFLRRDFVKALSAFESKEIQSIKAMLGAFTLEAIEKAFFFMLECQLFSILRSKAENDIGKMQFRTSRARRVTESQIAPLAELGLNRIRKNKLFKKDESDEGALLFIPTVPKELKAVVDLLQLEPPLIRALLVLWEGADFKLTVSVHVNLALLAKTTTNLNQRLAEILSRFGAIG